MTVLCASAYKQLRPTQKAYVDSYVAQVERDAQRRNERVSNALHRAIPPETVAASEGLLDQPMVRAAIAERINEIAAQEDFTWQRWLKEVSAVAFANVNDFQEVQADGSTQINLTKATPEAMAAIKSIETEDSGDGYGRGGKRKIKLQLHDKMGALKMMADFYIQVMQHQPQLLMPPRDALVQADAGLPVDVTVEAAALAYQRLVGE